MKKPPLVEITWRDAWSKNEDMTREEAEVLHLCERTSIGYFVNQDPVETRIAHTWDPPGAANDKESFCDVTVIWTPCITKLRYVRGKPRAAKPKSDA